METTRKRQTHRFYINYRENKICFQFTQISQNIVIKLELCLRMIELQQAGAAGYNERGLYSAQSQGEDRLSELLMVPSDQIWRAAGEKTFWKIISDSNSYK